MYRSMKNAGNPYGKKKRIYIAIAVVLWLLSFFYPVYGQSEPELYKKPARLYARSACLMDGESGAVLYGKEDTLSLANASTTKILTCILALESGETDQVMTVSEHAHAAPKVHLGAPVGTKFVLQDLLYAMMLESYNDTAVCIAEGIAGSVEAFAAQMNALAERIGCQDTRFITPNGLDASDANGKHHTTARDLALLMRYCVAQSPKKELFLAITQTPAYSFWDVEHQHFYNCSNHNTFLQMMEGAISGKTGFTADAGYCYVGALRRDDKLLIVTLLACGWPNHRDYKWADTRKLMQYGIEAFERRLIYADHMIDTKIPVLDGQYQGMLYKNYAATGLTYERVKTRGQDAQEQNVIEQDITGKNTQPEDRYMLLRKDQKLHVRVNLPKTLQAPVKKGAQIGSIDYLSDNTLLVSDPVYAKENVAIIDYGWSLRKITACFFTGI